jgi:hypothetical protein
VIAGRFSESDSWSWPVGAVAALGWIVYLAFMALRSCSGARDPGSLGRLVEKHRSRGTGRATPETGSARLIPVALLLLLVVAGAFLLLVGPHRRFPERIVRLGAKHGLRLAGGSLEPGVFSSTLTGARLSLEDAPMITVDIGRIDFLHRPFAAPRVTVQGAHAHLRGEPVALLMAITTALQVQLAPIVAPDLQISYEHRVLGTIRFVGVRLGVQESSLALRARRVQAGDLVWSDVALSFEPRKDMFVVGWGPKAKAARLQLSCFPSAGGTSRLLLNLLHQPTRPLLGRLGWAAGDDFDAARVGGALSLDVPDDPAQPPRGQVQLILDRWPLGAPASTGPLFGSSFSLLSSVVPAADGAQWELPRVEVTMSVFSLVGKGSVQLGRDQRVVLEAEGERTCKELRALLPASAQLESVRRFLDRQPAQASASAKRLPHAQLRVRWDTGAGRGPAARPAWGFEPGCGLASWGPQ